MRFVVERCEEPMIAIMNEFDDTVPYGLEIDMNQFLDCSHVLGSTCQNADAPCLHDGPQGTLLLAYPRQLLPLFDTAITMAQKKVRRTGEEWIEH